MKQESQIEIVLVTPEIPQNTGSTARLCASQNVRLHLIEPLGFSIDDKQVKRAGLDYWPEVKLSVHKSWGDFIKKEGAKEEEMFFMTTKSAKSYVDISYPEKCYLVFGCETKGLSEEFHKNYKDQRLLIPMENQNIRSINLAAAVSVVLFEARRQHGLL